MPTYIYVCPDGHETTRRAKLDDDRIVCYHKSKEDFLINDKGRYVSLTTCGKVAKRLAVYRDQGVIFSGSGFTRQVVPPPKPLPRGSQGESTDVAKEIMDEYAYEAYEHDKSYGRD